MKYERLVQFLNEVPKTDFFFDAKIVQEYAARTKDYNITKELLRKLNDEHNSICDMSAENRTLMMPPKSDYRQYIEVDHKLVAVYFPN